MSASEHYLRQRAEALGPWYQNIELAPGVWTNPAMGDYPASRWRTIEPWVPADLRGKSVLEIGCNAGFFARQFKARGAERVLGVDIMPHVLAQAAFVNDLHGQQIELRQLSAYDIGSLGPFDIVVCLGVLYHLKHPLYALERIAEVCRETLYFQSVVRVSVDDYQAPPDMEPGDVAPFADPAYPKLFFIEQRLNGDESNWWFATRSCLTAMLRVAGFPAIQGTPDPEIFVCRPGPARSEAEHG